MLFLHTPLPSKFHQISLEIYRGNKYEKNYFVFSFSSFLVDSIENTYIVVSSNLPPPIFLAQPHLGQVTYDLV